jgi:hypothetical protein
MSLKSSPIPPIPEVTACVARAAFPHGNVVMQLRDALGTISTDEALPMCFRLMVSPPKLLGAWHWSPSFNFWKA